VPKTGRRTLRSVYRQVLLDLAHPGGHAEILRERAVADG
jgi:hypothetical protein